MCHEPIAVMAPEPDPVGWQHTAQLAPVPAAINGVQPPALGLRLPPRVSGGGGIGERDTGVDLRRLVEVEARCVALDGARINPERSGSSAQSMRFGHCLTQPEFEVGIIGEEMATLRL